MDILTLTRRYSSHSIFSHSDLIFTMLKDLRLIHYWNKTILSASTLKTPIEKAFVLFGAVIDEPDDLLIIETYLRDFNG